MSSIIRNKMIDKTTSGFPKVRGNAKQWLCKCTSLMKSFYICRFYVPLCAHFVNFLVATLVIFKGVNRFSKVSPFWRNVIRLITGPDPYQLTVNFIGTEFDWIHHLYSNFELSDLTLKICYATFWNVEQMFRYFFSVSLLKIYLKVENIYQRQHIWNFLAHLFTPVYMIKKYEKTFKYVTVKLFLAGWPKKVSKLLFEIPKSCVTNLQSVIAWPKVSI